MPVPMSASAALKQLSPRKNFGNPRIMSVRDESPAPDFRSRTNSVKRKEPEGPTFAAIVSGPGAGYGGSATGGMPTNQGIGIRVEDLSDITLEIAKVSSLIDTAGNEVNDKVKDPAIVSVFSAICDAMRGISTVQDKVVTCLLKNASSADDPLPSQSVPAPQPNLVNLGAIPKKPRQDYTNARTPTPGTGTGNARNATNTTAPPSKKEHADPIKGNFIDSIREAERSTIIFNLNLGRVPIMNKDTLSKKATIALTTLAAGKEKKTGSIPSNDAIDAIDDVLSLAENYQVLGNTTKTYRNTKDPQSGLYCTAPIRYDFKNKDTRTNAEIVLRDRCGVSCAVPYPVPVRECIKQIVADVKKEYPDNFVKVAVDTGKLVFKIARKPPKNAPDPKWQYDYNDIAIPVIVMESGGRKLPEGFSIAPTKKNAVVTMHVDSQNMDGSGSSSDEELT
jgi:hypothetical protein